MAKISIFDIFWMILWGQAKIVFESLNDCLDLGYCMTFHVVLSLKLEIGLNFEFTAKVFTYCCLDFWPKTCLLLLEFPLLMLLLHSVEKQEILYLCFHEIFVKFLLFAQMLFNNIGASG